jgi:hypothetical protein
MFPDILIYDKGLFISKIHPADMHIYNLWIYIVYAYMCPVNPVTVYQDIK